MQNIQPSFYANDIFYLSLQSHTFCQGNIIFQAIANEMSEEPGSLKWYINDIEIIEARDQLTWNKYFSNGEFNIKMIVRSKDDDYITLYSTLYVGYEILAFASPQNGGTIEEIGCYRTNEEVVLKAIPNSNFIFEKWIDDNGNDISTTETLSILVTNNLHVIALFLNIYDIVLIANPLEGGMVFGESSGIPLNSIHTVSATPSIPYLFVNWTDNEIPISTDSAYTFIVTKSRTLVANFEKKTYEVNITVNEPKYGYVTGAGDYIANTDAQIEAFPNKCYSFANWTIDSVVVSENNPYIFTVNNNVDLVANFHALDFDTYSPTLWDNTFLLNLKRLHEKGYEVTGCKWFKNGVELTETNTINEYSYSAGPNETDILELAPTVYTFHLITKNFGTLCSSKKSITEYMFEHNTNKLKIFPNPVLTGTPFTVKGVIENSPIHVYNFMGTCVSSTIATDISTSLSLNLPAGIYLIRCDKKQGKIAIIE